MEMYLRVEEQSELLESHWFFVPTGKFFGFCMCLASGNKENNVLFRLAMGGLRKSPFTKGGLLTAQPASGIENYNT